METVKCGRKRKAESEPDDPDDLMQKAFQSLAHDHPFWKNVLPYLSVKDTIPLRGVNRNCRDIVDSYFSTALTLTVPSNATRWLVRIMMGNNKCVRTLKAQRCRAVDDIVPCFKYQDRLVSVDLSYSVFTSVENAVDTLVDYCRLLVKISLRGLSNYSYPLAARSVSWPFVGLLRNPLPHLQHLDIRSGSGGLSPAMFTSLLEKHPRLHTLSLDAGPTVDFLHHFGNRYLRYHRNRFHIITPVGVFCNHLILQQTDLDEVLEAWLSSPSLMNLTLYPEGESCVVRVSAIYGFDVGESHAFCSGCESSGAPLRILQCTRTLRKAEGEDASSPLQLQICFRRNWFKRFGFTLDAYKKRGGIMVKMFNT
ncbi:uncharacterized protein LOC143301827 [Babylonia areolata]|uniref:uncharacterized protein LOC143301827 n=1 Tax=Babylonia areolata TaxID=304850 RepID=UPI003FD0A926